MLESSDPLEEGKTLHPFKLRKPDKIKRSRGTFNTFVRGLQGRVSSYKTRRFYPPSQSQEDEKFLSMLAHDLKRPFTSLRVGLGLLRRLENCSEDERGRILNEIERICNLSCERAEGLLGEMLSSRGQKALQLESVRILNFLKECVTAFESSHGAKPIEFKYFVNEQDTFLVDRSRMQRVFVNLIENAEQALEKRREIWFESKEVSRGRMEIVVGNFGKAIQPEIGARMFRPFVTDKKGGTGLGLAIAKEIVAAHRGDIWFKADREHGTRFYIQLPKPVRKHTSVPSIDRPGPSETTEGDKQFFDACVQVVPQKIVVVEDSSIIRRSWENTLGSLYFVGFSSIEDFVIWMNEGARISEILCVITDYYFEGSSMTGGDLVKWMKENYKIPLFISTESSHFLPPSLQPFGIGKTPLSMEAVLTKLAGLTPSF